MVPQESVIDERVELRVRWPAALDAFEAGKILPKYLGEKYHRLDATCRREEEERFHSEISARDYEWHLRAVWAGLLRPAFQFPGGTSRHTGSMIARFDPSAPTT